MQGHQAHLWISALVVAVCGQGSVRSNSASDSVIRFSKCAEILLHNDLPFFASQRDIVPPQGHSASTAHRKFSQFISKITVRQGLVSAGCRCGRASACAILANYQLHRLIILLYQSKATRQSYARIFLRTPKPSVLVMWCQRFDVDVAHLDAQPFLMEF